MRDDLLASAASVILFIASILSLFAAADLKGRISRLAGAAEGAPGGDGSGSKTDSGRAAAEAELAGALAELEEEMATVGSQVESLIAAAGGSGGGGTGGPSPEAMAEIVRQILARQDRDHQQGKTERAIRNVGLTFDVNLRNAGGYLELREDQKDKIRKILEAELATGAPEILAAPNRETAWPIMLAMKERAREQIMAQLDDAQKVKYQKLKIDWYGNALAKSRPRP